ncbi:MAG: nitrogenase component 1 [Elusimicrobia bacterium]|nr:nitrogenase component 1 [Elusimicrobiota bacterium]
MRHITAGPRALLSVSRRLGLEGKAGWSLDGLCVEGPETLRLSLTAGGSRFALELLAGAASAPKERSPAQRKLLDFAAARLGGPHFAGVLAEIAADPDSFAEEFDPGLAGDRVKVPYVAGPMSLMEAGWRNFFADQDFDVQMEAPEATHNKTVTVEYADLECFLARPEISFSKWNFLDWPDESLDPEATGENNFIAVELEERDMVMGTGDKADSLVSEVRRLADEGNYLVVTHLCTPIVMGEDFQGLARRCEDEIGGTSVSWSQKDRDQGDNFGEHFRSVLSRPDFFADEGDASAVNLFHFPVDCRERELRPFLEALGLKVNVCLFPIVDFPSIERLPKARWQVFCEKPSYTDKTLELMKASSRPVVMARAPYGVEGMRECLRSIATAAGKEREFERAWAAKLKKFQPAWDELRREAAGHRLAFVVSEASLPRLLELRYGHGAPLATATREMGFGIDILYFDRHGEQPELPEGLRGAKVTVFRTPSELERSLRDGLFAAVYSDIFFDWRISRAGKARFSGREFEMGLEGARRSLERLLDACRLPFYRRHAKHLSARPRRLNV